MVTLDFVKAGKATFTLENKVTAKHLTFRVTRSKPTERHPVPAFFVLVMKGSDNEGDYSYMGVLNTRTNQLTMTARSRFAADSVEVRAFNYAMARIAAAAPDTDKVTVHHEGRCGRCGRLLTHPDSIESGIGPECGKFMHPGYNSTVAKGPRRVSQPLLDVANV